MKPLHEKEIDQAKHIVAESGRDPGAFAFDVSFMEPDPDGGGMFTVRYEVTVTNMSNDKREGYIGGIGLDWVGAFTSDMGEGAFG